MRNGYSKKIMLVALLCSFIVAGSCCINIGCGSQAKFERTDKLCAGLAPGSTLAVQTSFGSINITGADINRCDVTAEISIQAPSEQEAEEIAEKVKIRLEQEGGTLKVKIEQPHLGNNRCVGVSFKIIVPKETSIDCSTSFGSIKLADIIGNIEGETSFASIDCKNTQGPGKLKTSYGNINCHNITSGELTAHSSFGGIDITCSDSTSAEMVADVATSYGSIDFTAPPGFTGQVNVSTSFGSIRTEMPIMVKGNIGKDHLRGTIGEGSGNLRLKTSFGSIKIR